MEEPKDKTGNWAMILLIIVFILTGLALINPSF